MKHLSTVETEITPELAAKAFAHFGDDEQADFFEHLAKEVKATYDTGPYGYGEMQWCYMHGELQKRGGEGLAMYHAMSSFAFEFSQDNNLVNLRCM
jgi:predicted secreted hydrolase